MILQILRVVTATSAIYEIDHENFRVRRIGPPGGSNRVTDEWQKYESIRLTELGQSMIIVWPGDTQLLPTTIGEALATTQTSIVVSVDAAEIFTSGEEDEGLEDEVEWN